MKLERLAKIGENALRSEIEVCIRDVFDCVNYLAKEELNIHLIDRYTHNRKIDLNLAVANYITMREEVIECEINPRQYDNRVMHALLGISYIHSKFDEIIQGKKEIEDSREQIKKGNFYSEEEAKKILSM